LLCCVNLNPNGQPKKQAEKQKQKE